MINAMKYFSFLGFPHQEKFSYIKVDRN